MDDFDELMVRIKFLAKRDLALSLTKLIDDNNAVSPPDCLVKLGGYLRGVIETANALEQREHDKPRINTQCKK